MARFCDSNQKRGLTLVELIVVLVILAVLAALLVPSLTGYIDKAVEKRVMLQARSLMTAAQATIDEAYAKGELPIDNKGRFKQPNEDTAHKLAKQIIELSELDTQCQWQFSLADTDTDFPTGKIAILQFCNGEHYIVYRITPGRPAKRNPAGWSRVQKATSLPEWLPRDGLLFLKSSDQALWPHRCAERRGLCRHAGQARWPAWPQRQRQNNAYENLCRAFAAHGGQRHY